MSLSVRSVARPPRALSAALRDSTTPRLDASSHGRSSIATSTRATSARAPTTDTSAAATTCDPSRGPPPNRATTPGPRQRVARRAALPTPPDFDSPRRSATVAYASTVSASQARASKTRRPRSRPGPPRRATASSSLSPASPAMTRPDGRLSAADEKPVAAFNSARTAYHPDSHDPMMMGFARAASANDRTAASVRQVERLTHPGRPDPDHESPRGRRCACRIRRPARRPCTDRRSWSRRRSVAVGVFADRSRCPGPERTSTAVGIVDTHHHARITGQRAALWRCPCRC